MQIGSVRKKMCYWTWLLWVELPRWYSGDCTVGLKETKITQVRKEEIARQ
jgi:hypothetical protein